jgi:hypothetical protein
MMKVELIKDNEDGSAAFHFDMTPEEAASLLRYGIMEALKAGIAEGNKYKVEDDESNDGLENS